MDLFISHLPQVVSFVPLIHPLVPIKTAFEDPVVSFLFHDHLFADEHW